MSRKKIMLVIEKHEGGFMYHTGLGWADASGEVLDALKIMARLPLPRSVAAESRRGMAAFGKPFAVDRNEEKSW